MRSVAITSLTTAEGAPDPAAVLAHDLPGGLLTPHAGHAVKRHLGTVRVPAGVPDEHTSKSDSTHVDLYSGIWHTIIFTTEYSTSQIENPFMMAIKKVIGAGKWNSLIAQTHWRWRT